ncbi:MAG: hypothetical protein Q9164_004958 [Protoblastenia rupestris]
MASHFRTLATAALLTTSISLTAAQSGSGTTTRYWDCCKPSCAWPGKGDSGVVGTCDVNDQPLSDSNAKSGCEGGGTAYMCSSQAPWAVSDDLAYGFTAVSGNNPKCCQCWQLTFTSGPISGKKMIVQATNTGGDVGNTQFDLAMPGGGFGIFDGCSTQWGATTNVWGEQYGGPKENTCPQFPEKLKPGCGFRWDWMKGADNPNVDFEVVACPAEIVAKSGCGVAGGPATTGSDTKGSDTTGSDTTGSDTTGSDTMGSDTTGSDTTGADPNSTNPNGADPNNPDPNGADPNGADPNGPNPGGQGTTPSSSSAAPTASPTPNPSPQSQGGYSGQQGSPTGVPVVKKVQRPQKGEGSSPSSQPQQPEPTSEPQYDANEEEEEDECEL